MGFDISVCIANYNGLGFIDRCIESVLGQEGDLSVEIIVHDDASSDGSVEHIRTRYPDVGLIQSRENVGFCVANNRMAQMATGEYLLLLNNDAALFPDALAVLYAEKERLGRPAILGLPQYDAETGALLDIGSRLDPFLNPVPNLDPKRNDVGLVMGACLWIDKRLWDEFGGFPEWFGSIGEDLYLCCRARLAGYPVRALEVSGYSHWVGQSFGGGKVADNRLSSTFRRRALSERSKTFVMVITYPPPLMQIMLPLHLLLLLLEGLSLSLLKLDGRYLRKIYLPVFGALIKYRKEWWALRRIVQNNLQVTRAEFYALFDWMPYKLRMLARHGLPHLH